MNSLLQGLFLANLIVGILIEVVILTILLGSWEKKEKKTLQEIVEKEMMKSLNAKKN
jgi:hypothetical protein